MQIVDDVLDLTASSTLLGKPALNDIKSGLATAPVLLAAEEYPELKPLILRRFKGSGDLAQAVALIGQSQGIQRARDLAQHHCLLAADMVRPLQPLTLLPLRYGAVAPSSLTVTDTAAPSR